MLLNNAAQLVQRAVLTLLLILLGACGPAPEDGGALPASSQPNIVLILIDDMGFNDLGANGNPDIKTPNLDRLAQQGVRFTRHYTDSTCTATRIGVITGMPPARHGFRPDNLGLSPDIVTLPEVLRDAGYTTHHIGKWHIGFASRLAWPTAQGFDSFFGFLNQFLLHDPLPGGKWTFSRPSYQNPWLQQDAQAPRQYQGHLSAILADRAVAFIERRHPGDPPWFLNFWTYAPHTPIQPMAEYAEHYADDPAGRYRAFVEQVDATVGRVVAMLDQQGLADNTLLLVASDNGGTNRQIDNNAPYYGTKASFYEGGVRTPLIIRWPGVLRAGQVHDGVVSYLDYLPTLARAAGAVPPASLAGSDLVELVQSPRSRRTALYWEAGNSKIHSWSTLSADGRWRMTQGFAAEPQLFDLDARPSGDRDVLQDHPELAAGLHSGYISWRQRQRQVEVRYQRQGERGKGRLTGASLERAPGYEGHSFAIGVTPDDSDHPGEQIIALQPGQWQLSQIGGRLKVSIQGLELEAPAPPTGHCSSIIVASQFRNAFVFPKASGTTIELFVNAVRVAQLTTSAVELPADDYLHPTFLGQDAAGERLYRGRLGRPLVLNERLVTPDALSATIGNDVDAVHRTICSR